MGEVVQFPTKPFVENYFGGCPVCGGTDGFVNDGRDHWFTCQTHSAKWCAGSNLFSGWREETEADWRRNRALLNTLREVQPLRPSDLDDPCCPTCGVQESVIKALGYSPLQCCLDAEAAEQMGWSREAITAHVAKVWATLP